MKVSDILRVKGNTLYTVTPDESLAQAIEVMADKDIGSLVVMEHGDLVGMLSFREVIQAIARNGSGKIVRSVMDDAPLPARSGIISRHERQYLRNPFRSHQLW